MRQLAELVRELGVGHRFVYAKRSQPLYNALHDDVVTYMQRISPQFDGDNNLVTLIEAQAVDASVRQVFLRPVAQLMQNHNAFNTLHQGQQNSLNNRANAHHQAVTQHLAGGVPPVQMSGAIYYTLIDSVRNLSRNALPVDANAQNEVRKLLALALTVRARLCDGGDANQIANLVHRLGEDLRTRGDVRDDTGSLGAIAAQAKQLANIQHDIRAADQCANRGSVFNPLFDEIWNLIGQSRFCAEPKAFGGIHNSHFDDSVLDIATAELVGQTCIWWTFPGGRDNPAGYRVLGPFGNEGNAAVAGSYMWPCPSCRNRSGMMVEGLARSDHRHHGGYGVYNEV